MGVYQYRDIKKPSGGLRHLIHKRKRRYAMGEIFVPVVLQENDEKVIKRVMGGNAKVSLRKVSKAIVTDKNGKAKVTKILNVLSTPSNREYAKRNIITKGAIIQTSDGKARVTSRPGQDGIVNAVLID
ncbi:ribosomal protein S8.e [Caldisphaera lagunensis DSM 15908]|uniref:Small ribosomal subunit protein eS8 n=1 Tax=Caldisphaera lagunensis (strain DSM 15908 / JCM 11604 / ANMR 0165 / IC-154) TaxID=1056495 RepID=L0AC52_CALLD|nr:30S ribosomal protein S8e [Caldisphaera lagunensis]AFZ70605.1 ribosomal protein S8.e [Caldisphaera lagunensis DSM 15908]